MISLENVMVLVALLDQKLEIRKHLNLVLFMLVYVVIIPK